MWGCIVKDNVVKAFNDVPSLYVRVYRKRFRRNKIKNCSLTIREGVSVEPLTLDVFTTFPHYTWGCIALLERSATRQTVPSLYVRVYRACLVRRLMCIRSLTIREGVSRRQIVGKTEVEFPHYTWGCIDELKIKLRVLFVSSLYVRVYHLFVLSAIGITGSLTIREGVSFRLVSFTYPG